MTDSKCFLTAIRTAGKNRPNACRNGPKSKFFFKDMSDLDLLHGFNPKRQLRAKSRASGSNIFTKLLNNAHFIGAHLIKHRAQHGDCDQDAKKWQHPWAKLK